MFLKLLLFVDPSLELSCSFAQQGEISRQEGRRHSHSRGFRDPRRNCKDVHFLMVTTWLRGSRRFPSDVRFKLASDEKVSPCALASGGASVCNFQRLRETNSLHLYLKRNLRRSVSFSTAQRVRCGTAVAVFAPTRPPHEWCSGAPTGPTEVPHEASALFIHRHHTERVGSVGIDYFKAPALLAKLRKLLMCLLAADRPTSYTRCHGQTRRDGEGDYALTCCATVCYKSWSPSFFLSLFFRWFWWVFRCLQFVWGGEDGWGMVEECKERDG